MARRTAKNRDLPQNLAVTSNGFRYRHPQTGKWHYMGRDRERAKVAARKLNALLLKSNDLVAKVLGGAHTLADCIDIFEREDMPAKKWKAGTKEDYQFLINRIRKDYGQRIVEELSVKDCAEILRTITDSAGTRTRYRSIMGWLLNCAMAEGWIEANPVLATKKPPKQKRKRGRLTLEQYQAAWQHAPAWLRNAMDLSLHTLLRRVDVACMRFEDVKGDHLYVVPRKTETVTFVRLKMRMSPELRAVVTRCRDSILSPYLVHKLPERIKKSRQKDHHTQCSPRDLTDGFAAALQASGIAIAGEPPTFHEIRSLGADLYRKAGWTLEQVQGLMGHASEEMTLLYLQGHDAPWVEVEAGLAI